MTLREWFAENETVIKVVLLLMLIRVCLTALLLSLIPFGAPELLFVGLALMGLAFELLIALGAFTLLGALKQETYCRIVRQCVFGTRHHG